MVIHIGSSAPLRVITSAGICNLIAPIVGQVVEKAVLVTADGYVLTDVNGVYLTFKEE